MQHLRPAHGLARHALAFILAATSGCGDNGPSRHDDVTPDASSGGVVGIELSSLELVPAFSPDIHDYVVRCTQAVTTLTLTVTDETGVETTSLALSEDQLLLVREQYWIRCLPHDFPEFTVTTHPEASVPSAGWYLVNSPKFAVVFDTNGVPVWYGRGSRVVNFDAPMANTLAYMPNSDPAAYCYTQTPYFHVLDLSSLAATQAHAVAGRSTDVHDFRVLPNGNYVFVSYPITPHHDLTGLASYGADETIADCEIQIVDPQGTLVWSWLATDHIDPVSETLVPFAGPVDGNTVVDVFHCNSVEADAAGNFLVSVRHANAVYYVNGTTGTVQWKLGGSATNKDGAAHLSVVGDPQTTFSLQHDARFLGNGRLTLFDNHNAGNEGVARGVEYALDLTAGTATFVTQFPGIGRSAFTGSFRRYDDGESVVSWGSVQDESRVVTAYDEMDRLMLEIAMPGVVTYRAIKVPLAQLDISLLRATAGKQ
jgi:hypothetical protein